MPPKAPKQPSTDTIQELHHALGALTLKDDLVLKDAHPRPDFGSMGQPITVEANMFQVRCNGKGTVQHYDIDIVPVVKVANQKMPKPLAAKIWAQCCREGLGTPNRLAFESSAYDLQKNVYSPHKFTMDPNGKKTITVSLPEPGREADDDKRRFKVVLQHAQTIDLDSVMRFCKKEKQSQEELETVLTAIQAVNILLRDDPLMRFTPMGARGRFFGLEGAVPISNGAVVGKGFMQSFRPTAAGLPAIQLDTAFTAFFKSGNLVDRLAEILSLGGGGRGGRGGRGGPRGGRGGPPAGGPSHIVPNDLNPHQVKTLKRLLYGAKFTLPYRKSDRVFTIKNVTLKPAAEVTFVKDADDGTTQTIGLPMYFKQKYNITIQKPRLPCIQFGKNNCVPLELVRLCDFNAVPFACLSSDQAADMIRVAAQRPMDRAAEIKKWRVALDYSALPKLKAWGVEVNPSMMQVKARVLPPPRVTYGAQKQLPVSFGAWNLKGVKFSRPREPLKSWAVVSFDQRFPIPAMQGFIGLLVRTLKAYGVNVPNDKPTCLERSPGHGPVFSGLHSGLNDACRSAFVQSKANPQLVVCILPRRDTAMYQEIKFIAAMKLKEFVPTQCLQSSKLMGDRGLDQYCGNVSMKIQAKLGGVTHEVPIQALDKTTMMVGADVTHPPGGHGLLHPSIAVTVAGIDGDNVRFEPGLRLQEGRVEIIRDLENMFVRHIKTFEANTRSKPAKILVFRDGVSEGQYSQVCKLEVEAIRAAAKSFGGGYKPKITFVICAKRHNMRFFPMKQADADRTGNLKPGTVVDSSVTHPFAFDFYLQAHAGLQGTARPTHYVVLVDENGFTADKMQMLCNHLCYTYARATRAVSMVPVAYYADIIANQCRFMAYNDDESDAATTVSGTTGRNETRNFDPMLIARRLTNSPSNQVAWYM